MKWTLILNTEDLATILNHIKIRILEQYAYAFPSIVYPISIEKMICLGENNETHHLEFEIVFNIESNTHLILEDRTRIKTTDAKYVFRQKKIIDDFLIYDWSELKINCVRCGKKMDWAEQAELKAEFHRDELESHRNLCEKCTNLV